MTCFPMRLAANCHFSSSDGLRERVPLGLDLWAGPTGLEIVQDSRVSNVTMKTPFGSLFCPSNSPLRNRREAGKVSPSACLPTMQKALGSIPALYKLGMKVHACNLSTEVLEAEGSEIKGHTRSSSAIP